jgi:hypothetical protein
MTLKEVVQEVIERTKCEIVNDIDRHLWLDEPLCKEPDDTSS